jgi:hypothetical protein
LIELSADLDGPRENRLPPLISALSGGMVDLLVRAGADLHERPIGRVGAQTPLMTTAHKDVSVAEALLKAGARVEDLDDGWTALWYAACRGNWRVVSVRLRAGANPQVDRSLHRPLTARDVAARTNQIGDEPCWIAATRPWRTSIRSLPFWRAPSNAGGTVFLARLVPPSLPVPKQLISKRLRTRLVFDVSFAI